MDSSSGTEFGGTVGMWARVMSAWAAVGVAWETVDWSRLASMVAFFYTLGLLLEWWWKRVGRPIAESRGWVRRRLRRHTDDEEGDHDA